MQKTGNKQPSQRQLKVGEELRHILSECFMRGDFYDPDTGKTLIVTVSEVRISPDLRNATVYVMPLGGKDQDKTMETLKLLAPKLRSIIAHKIRLRQVPALFFKLDESFNAVSKLEALLNKPEVKQDLVKSSNEIKP